MVLESEQIKRMKSMNNFMKGNSGPVFEDLSLVVNSNNSLVKDIIKLNEKTETQELFKKLCNHVFDLAKMSKQHLSGEQMQSFIQRSNELMSELSSKSNS